MTEFKDTQQQLSKFRLRVAAAGVFVFVCFGLLVLRFLDLQVWRYSKYSLQAEENRISVAPIVPNRGIITDRNWFLTTRPPGSFAQLAVDAREFVAHTDPRQVAFEFVALVLVFHRSESLLGVEDARKRARVAFDRLIEQYRR